MRNSIRTLGGVVAGVVATFLTACGGGGSEVHAGAGVITITAFSPPIVPGGTPTAFTITGTNFETTTGTTARVIFHALGGATPFDGGSDAFAEVEGSVVSDTSITGTTPAATICGVVAIAFEVTVILESGVKSNTFTGGGLSFTAPTVTSVTPSSIPAEIPTTITVNGTGFGPTGGSATVRFISDGGFVLFGHASQTETLVQGSIVSATAITVLAPLAAVCGAATRTASIAVSLNATGSCSTAGTGVLTYVAPTIASINNPSVPTLAPGAFVITGTGYGRVGDVIPLTFTSATAIFDSGTKTTTNVTGLIVTSTTISGNFPAATFCGSVSQTAVIRATFNAGSCADSPAAFVTYVAPTVTAFSTAGTGGGANIARQTLSNTFNIVGTGFAQVGQPVKVRFFGPGLVFAVGNGSLKQDADVSGIINGATAIQGTTPLAVSAAPFTATVQVFFQDGTCTNAFGPITFNPPPVITSFVNTRPPFQQATPASLNADRCLACVSTPVQVNGLNFGAGATVAIFNKATGPTLPIGTGLLSTPVVAATQITGGSPTDTTLNGLTQATVQVTNLDQQVGTFSPVFFSTLDALVNVNASNEAGNNAEMNVAVNRTNPLNAVAFSHSGTGGRMFSSFTTNAGATWTTVLITAAVDGFDASPPAGQFRFVTDPNVGCDAFGNFYISYLEGLLSTTSPFNAIVGSTWRLVLLQSSTGGASWTNVRVLDSNVVPANFATLDRNEMGVGLARGGGVTDQAVYVAYHDFPNNQIRVNGFRSTGLGNLAAVGFGVTAVNNLVAPGANNYHHPAVTVGPHGELSVSFIERNSNTAPTNIWVNTDPDGLGSGALAFSGQVLVTTSNAPNNRIVGPGGYPIPQPNRGYAVVPSLEYVNTGPFVGRLVIAYDDRFVNDAFPGDQVSFGLRVLTRLSDSLGATWSSPVQAHVLDTRHQWQPWLAADPVTGNVYCTWFDSINGVTNNRAVQRFSSVSSSGGAWVNPLLLSQVATDVNGVSDGNDYLEYEGVAAIGGCVFAVWNSFTAGAGDIFSALYQQNP